METPKKAAKKEKVAKPQTASKYLLNLVKKLSPAEAEYLNVVIALTVRTLNENKTLSTFETGLIQSINSKL